MTSTRLSADANAIADLDTRRNILADSHGLADDLVADADGIV